MPGFALTDDFQYFIFLLVKISLYWNKNQQSLRCTGCYFVWPVACRHKNATEREIVFGLCFQDRKGTRVFASRALGVVSIDGRIYLNHYSDWLVFVNHFTSQMSHQFENCLAWLHRILELQCVANRTKLLLFFIRQVNRFHIVCIDQRPEPG